MRIVFMGTPPFSAEFLEYLSVDFSKNHPDFEVVGVVTQPDRPAGRGKKLTPPAVKSKALELDLPVLQPESLKDPEFHQELRQWQADLFVVIAFSILPPEVLEIPTHGSVNLHGSLLPKYRGAAPIQWAVVNGEAQTGLTIFLLDHLMDHGPVLVRKTLDILPDDTSADVFDNMIPLGKEAIAEALLNLQQGATPLDQDHSQATPARKIRKEDAYFDPEQSAQSIHNLVRGFYPWPGAMASFNGKPFKIIRTTLQNIPGELLSAQAGKLHFLDKKRLFLGCGDGWLEVLEVQPANKKAMSIADFYNGLQSHKELVLSKMN